MIKKKGILKIIYADFKRLEKFFKNLCGRILRHKECVNCENNFWWEKPFLEFSNYNHETEKMFLSISVFGVLFCQKCVEMDSSLLIDAEKIEANLIKKGWNKDTVFKIKTSVEAIIISLQSEKSKTCTGEGIAQEAMEFLRNRNIRNNR